jgi:hypothetical protein
MDDNKLKEIFTDFSPEIPSSTLFMERLQHNLESVEIIKRHNTEAIETVKRQNKALKKRNKKAAAISAAAGFITGIILTNLLPLLTAGITALTGSIAAISSNLPHLPGLTNIYSIITWIIIAAVSITTAINTYEITSVKLTSKQ